MSWNIGDNRNLFLKLKAKLGLYHVELKSKDSPKKITLTLVETQQLPDIEKADSKNEISCLKWTIYNGRRNVCINFQTNTDNVNIVVYRYRKNTYLKDTELELNWLNTKSFLLSAFTSWATLTFSTSSALYWMKQLSKCMFLLGFWTFLTWDGPKISIWWTHWLWKLLLGLCISLL